MKKLIFTMVLAALVGTSLFAQSAAPKQQNKIGAYLGWPSGFSYARRLSQKVELDVIAGIDSFSLNGARWAYDHTIPNGTSGVGFLARVAPLFTCWEGPLWKGAYGKVSVGPAAGFVIGGAPMYDGGSMLVMGFNVSAPARFDIDFNFPLNVFIEIDPLGFEMTFGEYRNYSYTGPVFYARSAIGARYRF